MLLLNTIALEPNRWTADKIPYYRLENLLSPISGAGFSYLEIWQNHITTRSPQEIAALKRQMDDLNIQTRIIGLYPNLHYTGKGREREIDTFQKAIDAAGTLNAHAIKIFVGMIASDAITNEEYDRSVAFTDEVADRLHKAGLTLIGETHANTLFDTPAACFRFLEDVGAERFKICFQPYDFASTENTTASYQTFADYVVHIHLQGRKDGNMTLLQEASIDYRTFFEALNEHGFEGDLSIEFVKDCVVDSPADFDLEQVIDHAKIDREFVARLMG